ncbi:MAG: HAMP domain-containing protein [Acidobacteria bacterium]|nr:HAMP domain-containing protein [Acidobacteriota bacterium]
MTRTGPAENTSRGILVLLLLFVILIGVIVAFSRQLIGNIATANPAANTLALAVAVFLPLILLGITVFQIVRMLRQRALRAPGAALKLRLTVFFGLIAVLAAGPQILLAITFINSAMGTWFSASIGEALRGASRISIDYLQEKVRNIESFADSSLAPQLAADFAANPDRTWRAIQGVNTGIGAVQLFASDGRELAFRGDARARVEGLDSLKGLSGIQPREDRADVSILRDVKVITAGGRRLTAVFSALVSKDLDRRARKITESLTTFNQVERYRELFQIVLVAFFFLFSLPIFFITILVSILLTERIISPIVHLEDATRRVAEGDFSFRILTRPRDELANLVDAFNIMVAELERSRRKLLQAERITAWQEIAQRLAHEIRNPLTPIKLSAQRILKKHSELGAPEQFDRVLFSSTAAIIREVETVEKLLREFSEFAKLPVPQPAPVNLRELLGEVASTYAHMSGTVRIDLEEVPRSIVLRVDPGQIRQVFANLFKNAIQAMPSGGVLAVRADTVKKASTSYCRIAVSDTGTGIDEKDRERIFDPYFTTKKDGTGLGLAIVQRILFDHKGNVWVESDGRTGTTFFIDLPAAPPAGAPAGARA